MFTWGTLRHKKFGKQIPNGGVHKNKHTYPKIPHVTNRTNQPTNPLKTNSHVRFKLFISIAYLNCQHRLKENILFTLFVVLCVVFVHHDVVASTWHNVDSSNVFKEKLTFLSGFAEYFCEAAASFTKRLKSGKPVSLWRVSCQFVSVKWHQGNVINLKYYYLVQVLNAVQDTKLFRKLISFYCFKKYFKIFWREWSKSYVSGMICSPIIINFYWTMLYTLWVRAEKLIFIYLRMQFYKIPKF